MATAKPPTHGALFDAAGQVVRIGAEIGHGGEGSVYEVAGTPDLVAKLYVRPPDADKAAKLAAMIRAASPALTEVAAWPTTTLHPRGGGTGAGAPLVGVVMPRASGAPVHNVYSPVSRKRDFPSFDWHKLVIVAHNVAAAIARLHAAGHVIGDVNQGNLLVGQKGIVRLIDCDSYQIRDGQRWFPCEVGVAHFTPPELQGRSFAGITRTPNHDAFGLAVLVFHLLFMGRHPFAGRYAGKGDMPLEQAIAEFRFAFGRHAGAVQMAPPPHALPLASASPSVAELFERAFGRDSTRDGGRPSAAEWKTALATVGKELATCAASPGHKYPRALAACPWCAIARGGGPDFFANVLVAVHHLTGFNAVEVWSAILAVPAPEVTVTLPAAPKTPGAATQTLPRWRRVAWQSQAPVAFAAGVALLAGTTGPWARRRSRRRSACSYSSLGCDAGLGSQRSAPGGSVSSKLRARVSAESKNAGPGTSVARASGSVPSGANWTHSGPSTRILTRQRPGAGRSSRRSAASISSGGTWKPSALTRAAYGVSVPSARAC